MPDRLSNAREGDAVQSQLDPPVHRGDPPVHRGDPATQRPARDRINPQSAVQSMVRRRAEKRLRKIVIHLQQLSKQFGGWQALSDVNLEISDQITGLLGPNGAGKSTLIKILLGLVKPSTGGGRVFNHDIHRQKLAIRQLVGYMPEDDCYIDGLTGIEMVQMSGQFYGLPAQESLRRAHEILDFCNFKQERYREISGYSTGMRQQIKFASAIVHNPQFLILDEPTSGLDPEERERLLKRVRFLNYEFGVGVLLSTHILPDVQMICDEVIILAAGQVRRHQALSELQSVRAWTIKLLDADGLTLERFCNELQRQQMPTKIMPDGSLSLSSEKMSRAEVAEKVWQIGAQANVTIGQLYPTQESLEAIFLKAIEGSNNASS